ncbi:hypothetical protein [Treponema putidum]|uniref:4-amino-4-deoxy-L-arabinose transferase-like glycosyltransferase n=1 Tax=Treponema putidum TaxID=221027 RepID=A0ABY5HT38_9SPIR|nr:hypothetical protein [Treponema putidum]UTY28310.1 hypothetical protein E4N76_04440 [Treponema putidum]
MKTFFNKQKNAYDLKKLLPVLSVFLGVFLLIITLLPLFMLCLYNHPTTLDDFRNFNSLKNGYDFFSVLKIGARYATPPVLWLFTFSFQPTMSEMNQMLIIYRLYSLFFILFFAFSVFFTLKQCNTYFLKMKYCSFFLFYTVCLFVLLNCINNFAYFFYDIVFSAGYTYGICLILLFIGILIKYTLDKKRIIYSIVLFFLTFIISGTIEYYSVLLGFILFIYLVSYWIKEKKVNMFFVVLFLLCFFTSLTYIFASWVPDKIKLYTHNIETPHSFDRFFIWLKDTCFYFFYNFLGYSSFDKLPFIIILSLVSIIRLNKAGYKIKGIYLLLPYIIVIIMNFALFFSGIIYLRGKLCSMSIFNLILAINVIFIFMYIFQNVMFLISYFIKKYDLIECIDKIVHALQKEFMFYRKMLSIVFTLIAICYIGFIGVYTPGLATRQAWKDVLKGTAARYSTEVLNIYEKLIESSEKIVEVNAIKNVPNSIVVYNFWSMEIPSYDDISLEVGSFFNKETIKIIN